MTASPLRTSVCVLLVEDDPHDAALVREALEGSRDGDFSVSRATCLAEAVSALGRQSVDVILLDLTLPDSFGIATLTRIVDAAPDVPAVVLTDTDDVALEVSLVRIGAQGCLLKGEIDHRTLGSGVCHAIERSRILQGRRRVEKALQRSEADLLALVETLPEAVAVHQHGLLVYLNPACQRMLDPERGCHLFGKPIADCVHSEDRASLVELMVAVERGERPTSARDLRLRRTDGELVETEMVAMPVYYGGGPAVLTVARNLTERERLQPQAIRADRAVALGILAAGLAHEINNPLSYVIGNLDFLHQEISRLVDRRRAAGDEARAGKEAGTLEVVEVAGEDFEELLESIEDAREGANRVRELVADLGILSRDDDQPEREIQVEPLLESVIKMLWGEICARARLVRSYEPVAAVRASPTRLTQVFLKLLTNAIQALSVPPPGGGEIQVSLRRRGQTAVLVEVRDNGPGIAPELQSRVFDLFYTDAPLGQRGPGLSVCQTLIAEIGGEITLESRVGGGCAFRVELPAAQRVQPPRRALTAPSGCSTAARSG